MEERKLPAFNYYLDDSDPDILLLCRQDGAFVAAFSFCGASKEGIIQAAQEDYRAVRQEYKCRCPVRTSENLPTSRYFGE